MNQRSDIFTTRRAMIRFAYGREGLPSQAAWPFTYIRVTPQQLTLNLFLTSVTLSPIQIATIEEYRQSFTYGKFVNEHGFRILLHPPMNTRSARSIMNIDIALRGKKDFENLANAFLAAGFTVSAPYS